MIKKNGFTLLEAVISTSIVMIGIMGILIISQYMALIVYDARDKLTAVYLAKEGVEIVRNIRDTNFLKIQAGEAGVVWNTGLDSGIYEAQYNSENLIDWGGNLEYLKIDGDGFYNYINGTTTIFRRKIIISDLSGVEGIKVEVRVEWPDQLNQPPNIFEIEENLYNNWQ